MACGAPRLLDRIPGLVMTVLVVTVLFGFPLALVLAWAFEVTPEGVRRTEALPGSPKGVDPGEETARPAHPGNRRVPGAAVLFGGGALLAGPVGWWILAPGDDIDVDVLGIRSVAVLPLDNFSGDPEQEAFVSGMHEELINQLSRVGALLVKSRTSVMRYRSDSLRSISEIGRELGVDAVLEGSVLRVDDQVRITVQLIHVPTDTHLWSDAFDRELRNVLALHSDVARAVADEVHAVLTPEENRRLASTREVDPEALEHYVRGRYLWNQREEGALREALAYGLVGEWAWEDAERHFRRAIALNPSYATAHQWYAELLAAENRMDEAVASARRATVRDPLSPIIGWNLARILYFARRPREALAQLRQGPDHRGDPIRGHSRYREILRAVGLAEHWPEDPSTAEG